MVQFFNTDGSIIDIQITPALVGSQARGAGQGWRGEHLSG